jgi:hypothetical protein
MLDNTIMKIAIEAWGGIAITWYGRLAMLVDVRDAWIVWDGRLVQRIPVGIS